MMVKTFKRGDPPMLVKIGPNVSLKIWGHNGQFKLGIDADRDLIIQTSEDDSGGQACLNQPR